MPVNEKPDEEDRPRDIIQRDKSELVRRPSSVVRRGLEQLSRPRPAESILGLGALESIILVDGPTPITCAAISPSDRLIVTGEQDGSVKVLSMSGQEDPLRLGQHAGAVTSVSFVGDDQVVYSAAMDGVARLYETRHGYDVEVSEAGPITASDVAPDGSTVVTGMTRKDLFPSGGYEFSGLVRAWDLGRLWNQESGSKGAALIWERELDQFHFATIIKVSSDSRLALYDGWRRGQWPAYLEVAALRDGSLAMPRYSAGAIGNAQDAVFTHDGRQIVLVAGLAQHLSIGDSETKEWSGLDLEHDQSGRPPYFGPMAISPDGHYLLLGQTRGQRFRIRDEALDWAGRSAMECDVYLYDRRTGKRVTILEGHTDEVTSVSFFSGMRFALTAGLDSTVRIWRLPKARN